MKLKIAKMLLKRYVLPVLKKAALKSKTELDNQIVDIIELYLES